jgi:5-methylcytosine-specific restriction endonuclease McrA
MYKKNYRRGNRKNQIKTVEQADKWISNLKEEIASYEKQHSLDIKTNQAIKKILKPLSDLETSISKQKVIYFLLFFDYWPSKAKDEFKIYKNKLSEALPKVLSIIVDYNKSVIEGVVGLHCYSYKKEYFEEGISKLRINDFEWRIFDDLSNEIQRRCERDISFTTNQLEIAQKKRNRIIDTKAKLKRKKETENRKKALLAQATGTTRDLGTTIKKQLSIDHLCPYCDQPLGNDYHADHIYPVSKGGQSRPENMVNVCARCNMEKSNRTLVKFIQLKGLNRERIERNLQLLGKEF